LTASLGTITDTLTLTEHVTNHQPVAVRPTYPTSCLLTIQQDVQR